MQLRDMSNHIQTKTDNPGRGVEIVCLWIIILPVDMPDG